MITYKIISKAGERKNNEDCTGMHQIGKAYGFFLCDGLGGHGKGEIASKMAVEQAILQFEDKKFSNDTLSFVFEAGQAAILEHQLHVGNKDSMKTTMTALFMDEKNIQWGHIGDSRIYYFKNKRLVSKTMDHSVPQMLAAAGEIQESQIRLHPDRNRLLRVMGTEWNGTPYQIGDSIARRGEQAFLLCSDGFWEWIEEKEMVSCLEQAESVGQWLDSMEKIVLKNGAGKNMDNYSAITIWSHSKRWFIF